MKATTRIYYLIWATILIILANTVFFLHQSSINKSNYDTARVTYETLETANELKGYIRDAETGQRGYLLTRDTGYLRPYNQAKHHINPLFDSLYTATGKTPLQLQRLNALKNLIERKQAEMQLTIKLKKQGESAQAYELVRENTGMLLMREIRTLISQIIEDEQHSLQAKNQAIERLTFKIQVFAVISNWILLIIIIIAWLTIIRNRRKIGILFDQLDSKTKQLEGQKSELQQLSHNLIKQNGELERFAHVASHDLRSPAKNIKALLELYNEARYPEEKATLVQAMHDVSDSLLLTLNELVEILKSKHDSNDLSENLNFHDIYNHVIKNLSADIRSTNAKIECDFSKAPEIQLPKSYLESILQNLISNALKYRHPERQPEIIVKSYTEKNKTCFKISDNGLGIDLKKHGAKLFGLYNTFHSHRDSKGVGLYITKAQVLAMGGKIDVDSIPGQGTTFTICF